MMQTTVADLPSLSETIRQALRLEPSIFAAIQQASGGIWLALAIVFLACLSESVGQSIILFINHVRPRRFVLALLIATLSRVSGFLLWSICVWLVISLLFGRAMPVVSVASAVGLAYAPQLLAFFVLTPFLGNPFSILLSLWSMLAIIVAVRIGFNLEMWQAVVTSGLGWLLIQVWQRTLGRPVYALGRWIERRAAGVPLRYSTHDVPRLRRRGAWFESLPNWKKLHERAERYLHNMHIHRGDSSRGGDAR
ncbi:MAG: hypothetical protein KJZ93_10075 [Caldilineaceae bacterium]|nr:hypothetical protein [Caldilineaceae bacterium]